MSSKRGIYYQTIPRSEYEAHEEERLDNVCQGQLYDLLALRTSGEGPEAFRLVVGIRTMSQLALSRSAQELFSSENSSTNRGLDALNTVVPGIAAAPHSHNFAPEAPFEVIYTDKDLHPVSTHGHPSSMKDKYWCPKPPLPLKAAGKFDCISHIGIFLPHYDTLDDEFLCMSQDFQLDVPVVEVAGAMSGVPSCDADADNGYLL